MKSNEKIIIVKSKAELAYKIANEEKRGWAPAGIATPRPCVTREVYYFQTMQKLG